MVRALLALLALAACASAPGDETEHDETIDLSGYNLTIGPDGAAGISEALPMDNEVIAATVAPFMLGGDTHHDGSREVTLWTGDVVPEFVIYSTADGRFIREIVAREGNVKGPYGEGEGTNFYDIPIPERAYCVSQPVDEWHGFSCSTGPDGRFWRVFRLAWGQIGPHEPFSAIRQVDLESASITEMRWIAPPPAEN
jgi:hypothetical protein